jgi:hypothetical protein
VGNLGYDDVGVDVDDYDVGDYAGVDVGDDVDGYDCDDGVMKSLVLENLYVNQLCELLLYLRKHLQSFK